MATPKLDMTALSPEQLAQILQKAGAKQVTDDDVRRHIAAGAPVSPTGKLHFIHYSAWLTKQVR